VKFYDNSGGIFPVKRRGEKRTRQTTPTSNLSSSCMYTYRAMEYIPGKGASDNKLAKTFATFALEVAGLNLG